MRPEHRDYLNRMMTDLRNGLFASEERIIAMENIARVSQTALSEARAAYHEILVANVDQEHLCKIAQHVIFIQERVDNIERSLKTMREIHAELIIGVNNAERVAAEVT